MKLPLIKDGNELPRLNPPEYSDNLFRENGELFIAKMTPEMVIEAHKRGVFAFYDSDDFEEIYKIRLGNHLNGKTVWCYPEDRYILDPKDLLDKIPDSRSLKRASSKFEMKVNEDFEKIIRSCKSMKRKDGWISDDFIDIYLKIHEMGYAHSVGAYKDGKLMGGLFGLGCGEYFQGDSMFRNVDEYGIKETADSSKASLIKLAEIIGKNNGIIDIQYQTDFFEDLGGKFVSNSEFYDMIHNVDFSKEFK